MSEYKMIDMDNWPRREHYKYYTEQLKVEFNMTANVDVKALLEFCHSNGYNFYPTLIYCVTRTINRIENFRMFKDTDGKLCVWEKVVPNYTIFHEDDHTFSDCWTDYSEEFEVFYQDITSDMQRYAHKKGIKVKDGQPPNFYCFSAAPWTTFTGYGSKVTDGVPMYFPVITAGKYEECGDKINLPVNITIAHAVADGYHVGLFFQYLQEEVNELKFR